MSETTTDRLAEIEEQAEPQPVQVREGRWRTRGGEVKYIKAGGSRRDNHYSWPWTDTLMCWQDNGFYHASKPSENDLVEYLGPIEPQPEPQPEPPTGSDAEQEIRALHEIVDAQAKTVGRLNSEINALNTENVELQIQVESLNGRLQEQTAKSAKRLEHVKELRSEVSYVQGLLGEEKLQNVRLETLVTDLRAVNTAQEKAVNSAAREKADLGHRLDTVAAEWAVQAETIRELQTQLEAVKAELVQERLERNQWQNQVLRVTAELDDKTAECRNLRIELDALQQAPQAETVAPQAVSERWEESYNKGAAQAVETIAEWTEPFRTCGSQGLAYHVMQNLPHIMRSLTGLTEED